MEENYSCIKVWAAAVQTSRPRAEYLRVINARFYKQPLETDDAAHTSYLQVLKTEVDAKQKEDTERRRHEAKEIMKQKSTLMI